MGLAPGRECCRERPGRQENADGTHRPYNGWGARKSRRAAALRRADLDERFPGLLDVIVSTERAPLQAD